MPASQSEGAIGSDWTLFNTWSSDANNPGNHWNVDLNNGNSNPNNDNNNLAVSCVR